MYILLESKRLQVQIILFNPQKKSLHMLVKKLSFGKTIKVNKFHTFLFMGWQVLGKLYLFIFFKGLLIRYFLIFLFLDASIFLFRIFLNKISSKK